LSGAAPDVGVPVKFATGTAAIEGLIHAAMIRKTAHSITLVDFIPVILLWSSMIPFYKIMWMFDTSIFFNDIVFE
jgi:hypothetical protein